MASHVKNEMSNAHYATNERSSYGYRLRLQYASYAARQLAVMMTR